MLNFLKRVRQKWTYSVIGIWTAFKEEKSLWSYLFILPVLIGIGIWVKLSWDQWAIIILVSVIILAVEVLNTALEATVDSISFQYNIKVKKIKDIAAGATLITNLGSLAVVLMIYIPKIMEAV